MTNQQLLDIEATFIFIDQNHSLGIVNNTKEIENLEKCLTQKDLPKDKIKEIKSNIRKLKILNNKLDKAYVEAYGKLLDQLPPDINLSVSNI